VGPSIVRRWFLHRSASADPARAGSQERGQVTVDQETRLRLPVFHEAIDDEAGIQLATDQFGQASRSE
jgi:hypothetical protein